jgi:hypothetical protein
MIFQKNIEITNENWKGTAEPKKGNVTREET